MGTTYRIAVIPGDGIGKEVVPESIRAHCSELGQAIAERITQPASQ